MNLVDVFAVLKPGLGVDTVPLSPTLYADLDANYEQFKGHVLVSSYSFAEDWPTWECHPAGDEIVVLLSGTARMLIRVDGEDQVKALRQPGEFVVVPRGHWHTAKMSEPTQMLFITPGEGTNNAAQPPSDP